MILVSLLSQCNYLQCRQSCLAGKQLLEMSSPKWTSCCFPCCYEPCPVLKFFIVFVIFLGEEGCRLKLNTAKWNCPPQNKVSSYHLKWMRLGKRETMKIRWWQGSQLTSCPLWIQGRLTPNIQTFFLKTTIAAGDSQHSRMESRVGRVISLITVFL